MPGNIPADVFEQTNQPGNWDMARYGAWEGPLNVLLVPKLPSTHMSGTQYSVCMLVMKKDVSADSVEDMDVDEPILPVVVEDLLEDLLDLRVDDEAPEDL